jgi:hypothetical protein
MPCDPHHLPSVVRNGENGDKIALFSKCIYFEQKRFMQKMLEVFIGQGCLFGKGFVRDNFHILLTKRPIYWVLQPSPPFLNMGLRGLPVPVLGEVWKVGGPMPEGNHRQRPQ